MPRWRARRSDPPAAHDASARVVPLPDAAMPRSPVASAASSHGRARPRCPANRDHMLYLFLYPLSDQFHALNVFRYITFRAGGAVVTALLISFIAGPGHHRLAQIEARRRPADSRRRPTRPSRPQEGHADDGGVPHSPRSDGVDPLVGRSRQPLCVGRLGGDGRLRPDRLLRRLPRSWCGARIMGCPAGSSC